jgi:hypothetical protein
MCLACGVCRRCSDEQEVWSYQSWFIREPILIKDERHGRMHLLDIIVIPNRTSLKYWLRFLFFIVMEGQP